MKKSASKPPIKISFDASCLVTNQKSGVAYYTESLILQLAAQYPDLQLVGHYCDFLSRSKPLNLPQAPNISYRVSKLISARVLNMLRRLSVWLPFELLTKQRSDFHLFPAFIGWPSLFKTPSVPIIHDVTYLDYPELVSSIARHDFEKFVPRTIQNAAFVITNSQTSAASLVKNYQLSDEHIIVARIPPRPFTSSVEARSEEAGVQLPISKPFILFLGNIEPRKNIVRLIEAYQNLKPNLKEGYALVVAGGRGWNDVEIQNKLQAVQNDPNIILPGYVSEQQRLLLLKHASVFIMPSLYEGMGMPILEAMEQKLPVAASDIPVFHEICGEAALYFDPYNTDSITNVLGSLLANPSQRSLLIQSGFKNLERFSWQKTTQEVYQKIQQSIR